MKPKVAIIGLDSAEPSLVFQRWGEELPHLTALRRQGLFGPLESVIPAITVPAWACMASSKDPGTLGLYGFRNRKDYSYDNLAIATSRALREPLLWELLSHQGKRVIVLGVPPGYPPRPINGLWLGCFLTPSVEEEWTFPPSLRHDIARWVGEYMVDVKGFRTDRKDWLLDQIYTMTRQHFGVARRLLQEQEWDFFIMVEIGVDRIHHGFWKDMDPCHPKHDPCSPYREAVREYYRFLDAEVGSLLDCFEPGTKVFVLSDHGAQRMEGGFCLNEWLLQEGYLVLEEEPQASSGPRRWKELRVDWGRTRAWGEGGYYGRLFLNVQGREPQGIVAPKDYEGLREEIREKLEALQGPKGEPLGNRCFKPEEIYRQVRGVPPDLIVYLGNLRWRSIGSVGWGSLYTVENDTGPDEANHAQQGMFLYADLGQDLGGRPLEGLDLLRIAPTVLRLFGLEVPPEMQGKAIEEVVAS